MFEVLKSHLSKFVVQSRQIVTLSEPLRRFKVSQFAVAMSLALIQGYSSAEDEGNDEAAQALNNHLEISSDGDDDGVNNSPAINRAMVEQSLFNLPKSSSTSVLPSAFDVFSEVSGPPEFLNNSVEEYTSGRDKDRQEHGRRGGRRNRKDIKDLPAGVVVESKAQLVGIHERVRSDIENRQPPTSVAPSTLGGGKRVVTATNPNAEDAAALLRICLQCGVPKTYSNAKGMVCPLCGDRPPTDPDAESKKKGSTVKDKEKNKRMKGQSSHATWKSETEMQLRQQFD